MGIHCKKRGKWKGIADNWKNIVKNEIRILTSGFQPMYYATP
jgi:hypothetical protein